MAERTIEIPPGQEVRISLPGGETLVLTCGAGNNNSNNYSSNSSSGSDMPKKYVNAVLEVLGKRPRNNSPRNNTRKGGKSKRGGSLNNNNNGRNLENENTNNNGSNLENENTNNGRNLENDNNNNGSNLENENNNEKNKGSKSNVGPIPQGFGGPRGTVKSGGKRRPNGYMKFAAEMRPKILKEHPEMKSDVTQVAREIGKKWRALSAAEKAKY